MVNKHGLSHTKGCIVSDTGFYDPADTAMKIQLYALYCTFDLRSSGRYKTHDTLDNATRSG